MHEVTVSSIPIRRTVCDAVATFICKMYSNLETAARNVACSGGTYEYTPTQTQKRASEFKDDFFCVSLI